MREQVINIVDHRVLPELCGSLNRRLAIIEDALGVEIKPFEDGLIIRASQQDQIEQAQEVINRIIDMINKGQDLNDHLVVWLSQNSESLSAVPYEALKQNSICVTAKGRQVIPRTPGQLEYVNAMRRSLITFATGPAGTGKTYLAVAMAVNAFRNREVERIILTRPAVEAGENLGFLPGDLQSKIDPYMRPLYDSLQELMGLEIYLRNLERGIIEASPLAYMRGRTLSNAWIILDEAQNTTPEQMKMFLTRLGENSRAVVTGDITQIDLPPGRRCGLIHARKVLHRVPGLSFVDLKEKDVVRNPLVQRIVAAYESYESVETKKNQ
ncbi:MAG: PhoH family protein [Clostridiaceae bacterium]|nr:PhoH family protein [Clostridiaceae bacterium]